MRDCYDLNDPLFRIDINVDKKKLKKKKYLAHVLQEYMYQILFPSVSYGENGYQVAGVNITDELNSSEYTLFGHALRIILEENRPITIEEVSKEIIQMFDSGYAFTNTCHVGTKKWRKAFKYAMNHPVKHELMVV